MVVHWFYVNSIIDESCQQYEPRQTSVFNALLHYVILTCNLDFKAYCDLNDISLYVKTYVKDCLILLLVLESLPTQKVKLQTSRLTTLKKMGSPHCLSNSSMMV